MEMVGLVYWPRTLCCGRRNPGSNLTTTPLQLFFYFVIVHREDEEINRTQYFIANNIHDKISRL